MGRRIMHTWFWLGNPRERDHVEDLDIDWMMVMMMMMMMMTNVMMIIIIIIIIIITIKKGLLEIGWEGVDFSMLNAVGSPEHANKPVNFIKCVKMFGQLRNY
jgi:hypothetical protein